MRHSHFTGESVLDAARRRVAWIFDRQESGELKNIIVSISGGKDSTVLAHLALVEANRRGRRIGLFFLDEEAMYQSTIDQVEYLMDLYPENTTPMWLQVPFFLTNATSITEGQLRAWEPGEHKIWMRPKKDSAVKFKPWPKESEKFRPGHTWLNFYGVIDNFERCYENSAFLVGLRAAGESMNRWRAMRNNPITIGSERVYWGTKRGENCTLYPIFDWNTHDVWRYIHDQELRYNKVYDFQFKKGYSLSQMRVSSLIHEKSFKSIVDLPSFEPKTYDRLIKRVKGIALAQETGKTAKLMRCSKLPKNFTSWIDYRDFLLATHADRERAPIFSARFAKQLTNEYVARQQVRQLVLNDYVNNLPVDNKPDPRDALISYYEEVL